MVVREIKIVKKPRDGPLQDKPISFPPLENLHLDLMENKKKLKKNLPLMLPTPKPTTAKKAVNYSAAVISGVAAVAALDSKEKTKEKFTAPKDENASEEDIEGLVDSNDEEAVLDDDGAADDDVEAVEAGAEGAAETKDVDAPEDPYAGLSPEERESKEKEEYIWRFKLLKKSYKDRNIQDYNEHDDLHTMKQTYERTLREIQLEDNCETYRMYLIGGFMLMEFVSNNWMGVDLTGFTAHQMTIMSKYDRMLIELGEKSYNRWGSNLPVEIRLIGFIILQAGIFYLGKIIAEKGGGTMADIFKMFTGAPVKVAEGGDAKPSADDVPKKKMRGPSVKVEDLKKKVET